MFSLTTEITKGKTQRNTEIQSFRDAVAKLKVPVDTNLIR